MRVLLFVFTFAMAGMAHAGDPVAGEAKARMCMACHGAQGISPADIWPNLAGQKKGYLVKQIKAFKAGTRVDPSMAPMVMSLSDQDMEDIAAFYSGLGKTE